MVFQGAVRGEVSGRNCPFSLGRRNPVGKEDLNVSNWKEKGRSSSPSVSSSKALYKTQ